MVGTPVAGYTIKKEVGEGGTSSVYLAEQLTLKGYAPPVRRHNTVLIPIGGIQRAVVEALRYAESLSDDVRAVYVDTDPAPTAQIERDWNTWGGKSRLVVLESPFATHIKFRVLN